MRITKQISLLLCIILLCSVLLACSNENDNTTKPKESTEIKASDTAEVTEPKEPAPYTKGKVEGSVYTNEAADLTLRVPEGWIVTDDYELSTLMGITYNFEDYDAYLEEVAKSPDIFDLFLKDKTGDFSIMVLFQDMAQFGEMSAADFLEMQKASLIFDTATPEKSDVTEATYSGNKYAMLKVVSTPNEGSKVTQLFYARIVDGRMMSIMMTFPSDEPINPDTIFA